MARRRLGLLLVSGMIVTAACGGGDDDSGGPNPFEAVGEDGSGLVGGGDGDDGAGDDGAGDDDGGAGDEGAAAELGAVTAEADPLSAWIEVDGERYEFRASGTISLECSIAPDNVHINIQTPEDFFTLNGAVNQGDWLFTLTVNPPGDTNASYGGSPLTNTGTVGLDATSMSYTGDVEKVIGQDIVNAESVAAEFAVNCEAPGPDPIAEIGGTTFTAPFNSSSSIVCDVSPDDVDIRVQQQITARVQISIDTTSDGTSWLGNAAVSADEGQFVSTMPDDGTGLTIDGKTVTYEGVFDTPTGEADGTVSVTCP